VVGRSSSSYTDNGNYQTGAVPTGMNIADAKFLALLQPGLGMGYENMLKVAKSFELPITMNHTVKPTEKDAYLILSMRKLSMNVGPKLENLSRGRLSATNRDQILPWTVKPRVT
jgi:hypothetical protein